MSAAARVLLLALAGAALVVFGVVSAERSWGWTYVLSALGAVMILVALLRLVRRR